MFLCIQISDDESLLFLKSNEKTKRMCRKLWKPFSGRVDCFHAHIDFICPTRNRCLLLNLAVTQSEMTSVYTCTHALWLIWYIYCHCQDQGPHVRAHVKETLKLEACREPLSHFNDKEIFIARQNNESLNQIFSR